MSKDKPWFRSNQSGVGFRPATWQGWVVLLAAIAVLVTIVILVRTLL